MSSGWRITILAATMAVVGLGSPVAPVLADVPAGCNQVLTPVPDPPFGPGSPYAYQATLVPLLQAGSGPAPPPAPGSTSSPTPPVATNGGAHAAVREALGSQYAKTWMHHALQGWGVGLAPGPLAVAQARAAIVAGLERRYYSPDDASYIAERMHVTPQPYAEAELQSTHDQLSAALRSDPEALFGLGVGCRLSDAFRVEVRLFQPASPELVERVGEMLAPHGDRVRFEVSPHGPPSADVAIGFPAPTRAPSQPERAGRYIAMATGKRCVRGPKVHVAIRPGERALIRSLTLRVDGRRRSFAVARITRPIAVRLRGRQTTLDVSVRLRDGRRATQSVTLTRCR